jgi:NTP pyrophosphatase (non-canonical NTP hydrolase)
MNLAEIAAKLRTDLDANRGYGESLDNIMDIQALCVAEEAGELVGAYRRWAGKARRTATFEEVCLELADVLIVTAVFAERLGVDIDKAVASKLEIIYSRGWREQLDTAGSLAAPTPRGAPDESEGNMR